MTTHLNSLEIAQWITAQDYLCSGGLVKSNNQLNAIANTLDPAVYFSSQEVINHCLYECKFPCTDDTKNSIANILSKEISST